MSRDLPLYRSNVLVLQMRVQPAKIICLVGKVVYSRIIENTDARIVVHWRYGLVDSRYIFAPRNEGWGGWTDEYWTIYPDGVAIRDVARGIVFGDGWVETMFLSPPGTKPEENVEIDAISILGFPLVAVASIEFFTIFNIACSNKFISAFTIVLFLIFTTISPGKPAPSKFMIFSTNCFSSNSVGTGKEICTNCLNLFTKDFKL